MERLQKVMAQAGVASRRRCEKIILAGKVKVNGIIITKLGTKVSKDDRIEVEERLISLEKKVYLLLNKPTGYITSVHDPRGRKTVLDIIKGVSQRIYPVGRLDYDTSGLLLLTNDGDLAYKLTHPSKMINKTYRVLVKGHPTDNDYKQLTEGVYLKDGLTAPAKVEYIQQKGKDSQFILTIHEGRNRQVRRMCSHINHPVLKLKRVGFTFLSLKGMQTGEYRMLTSQEVAKLKSLVSLSI